MLIWSCGRRSFTKVASQAKHYAQYGAGSRDGYSECATTVPCHCIALRLSWVPRLYLSFEGRAATATAAVTEWVHAMPLNMVTPPGPRTAHQAAVVYNRSAVRGRAERADGVRSLPSPVACLRTGWRARRESL